MDKVSAFMQSGLLESFALGLTTAEETSQVEHMASVHPEIQRYLDRFAADLEKQALLFAIAPPSDLKKKIFEAISDTSISGENEPAAKPPLLHSQSQLRDYEQWLNHPANYLPANAPNVFSIPIGEHDGITTSIVWVKKALPVEVHEAENEQFLVVEGSCKLMVEEEIYYLSSGDYMAIPLHKKHSAVVTSHVRCKVILQRVAL